MWNLLLNEDERMIAESVRGYLSRELPLSRLRPKAAPIDLARVRSEMNELGWFAIGLPEAAGGSGLGLNEEMLVQRECGRYLVTPSVLAQVLGAHLALEAGDPDFARAIGTGEVDVAIAILPQAGSPRRPAYALDLTAGALLVGWTADGIGLFDSADLEGVAADECLDDSVRLDVGALDLSAARHWVSSDASSLPLRAQVLVAAASVGLAEHASDVTVEYAKTRVQFGSPIGSFQAVKHRCADMGVRWRLAWYQTCLAALKVQTGAEDAALEASAAKLVAADAAHENGRASIQVHGGIGYQSEGDAHWFMKRAHTLDQIGGSIGAQARRIARAPTAIR